MVVVKGERVKGERVKGERVKGERVKGETVKVLHREIVAVVTVEEVVNN